MVIAEADTTIRRRVVASARRLIALDAGVPIARIAADAGVSRATFYRHFGSRGSLLRELRIAPPRASRERVLETAAEMLQRRPLAEISMDDLAAASGVSRATLYRLYAGKPQLLRALIERYAPFEDALAVLRERGDSPPQVVLPRLAHAVVRSAGPRLGVVRAILIETTSGAADNLPGVRPVLQRALGALATYLASEMDAGRIRRMHPILALQVVLGPVAFHLLTRPVAAQVIGLDVDAEAAVDQLTRAALEGLLP